MILQSEVSFSIDLQHLFQISKCIDLISFLSFRQRLMRGNRNATPDLCRLLAAMPSKAISKTSSGFTVLTGQIFLRNFFLQTNLLPQILYRLAPNKLLQNLPACRCLLQQMCNLYINYFFFHDLFVHRS